jgi:hypothetical protein
MKSRPNLEPVTLVCISGIKIVASLFSIIKSSMRCRFGAIVFITPALPEIVIGKFRIVNPTGTKLDNINEYNKYCIYELHKDVGTAFCLLIQYDSGVVNSNSWTNEFLKYDYIGAPWPIKADAYVDPFGVHQRVGNGGFSLRSRRLLNVPQKINIPWDINKDDFYNTFNSGYLSEDGNICVHNRHLFVEQGCKFAPLDVAVRFASEIRLAEHEGIASFGYHKYKPNSKPLSIYLLMHRLRDKLNSFKRTI